MKAPIKLLSLWFGDLPPWHGEFQNRMHSNRIVDWELIRPESVEHVNGLVTSVRSRKASPYALCDLRPLFGRMFAYQYAGYDWWGWCDLDVAFGDLDNLLSPLLDDHDIISSEAKSVAGPFTILRNTPEITNLYRSGAFYAEVLADPSYCNWDEDGFGCEANPSFTQLVKASGLRVRWDDRGWAENREPLWDGVPSRCCRLAGNRLFEVPTERELLLYHFTSGRDTVKRWPLPNPYLSHYQRQKDQLTVAPPKEAPPGECPEFWDARIHKMLRHGERLHTAVYDTSSADWTRLQTDLADAVRKTVKPGAKILDCGCGWGALLLALEAIGFDCCYTGVDYSPGMIRLAGAFFPNREFVLEDLRHLSWYKEQKFDLAVCRGVEGSVRTLLSNADWNRMEEEMLRVAKKVLVSDLDCHWRVIEQRGIKQ